TAVRLGAWGLRGVGGKHWRRGAGSGRLQADPVFVQTTLEGRAMRLCRYQHNGNVGVALYEDARLVNRNRLAEELVAPLPLARAANLLDYLPPDGRSFTAAQDLEKRFRSLPAADQARLSRPLAEARLRVPIPEPKKVILLAGNYAAHIQEG